MRWGRATANFELKLMIVQKHGACPISSCAHGTSDAPFMGLCLRIFISVFQPSCGRLFMAQEFYNDVHMTQDFTVQRFHELACRSGSFCWPPRISLDGLGWSVKPRLWYLAPSPTLVQKCILFDRTCKSWHGISANRWQISSLTKCLLRLYLFAEQTTQLTLSSCLAASLIKRVRNRRRLSTLVAMFSQGPSSTDGAFNEDTDDTIGFTFPLNFESLKGGFWSQNYMLLPWHMPNLCTMSCYEVTTIWVKKCLKKHLVP